jgi:hypothetical protein
MSQSRRQSMIETFAGVAIGFAVSVGITAVVMPAYGHDVKLGDNLQITVIFTVASVIRSYLVRRAFNSLGEKR